MTTGLSDLLGALATAVAKAREVADFERARLQRSYARYPQLRGLTVPRLRMPRVEFEIPVRLGEALPDRHPILEDMETLADTAAEAVALEVDAIGNTHLPAAGRRELAQAFFAAFTALDLAAMDPGTQVDALEHSVGSPLASAIVRGVYLVRVPLRDDALRERLVAAGLAELARLQRIAGDESPAKALGIQQRALSRGLTSRVRKERIELVDGFEAMLAAQYSERLRAMAMKNGTPARELGRVSAEQAAVCAQALLLELLADQGVLDVCDKLAAAARTQLTAAAQAAVAAHAVALPASAGDRSVHIVVPGDAPADVASIVRIRAVFTEDGSTFDSVDDVISRRAAASDGREVD
ncbi:MAG: hypothetical protein V3V08_17850 [Nannocystaceae bacterium]